MASKVFQITNHSFCNKLRHFLPHFFFALGVQGYMIFKLIYVLLANKRPVNYCGNVSPRHQANKEVWCSSSISSYQKRFKVCCIKNGIELASSVFSSLFKFFSKIQKVEKRWSALFYVAVSR